MYLVHSDGALGAGPWEATFELVPGLHLVDSESSRSVVYHAVKHGMAAPGPLLVAELDRLPKLSRMAPGAVAWATGRGLPR